jgi:transglutaminase-like putative cysteine protease
MTLSPLVGLKRELTTNPAVPVFTVSAASGRTVPSRIRTAYLSDFDGVIWRDSDKFVRPPATISTGLSAAGRSSQTVRITLQQLPGPYLPVVGDPVSLEGDSLVRGQTRGNVVNGGGSLPGRSYQVTALTSVDASDVRLKTALTGGPEWRAGDVELPPGLPDVVREASLTATTAASTPYDKAVALQNYVRQTAGYSLKPPPGESYAAVALLLSKQAPYTAAFAEQRASAFVVLARAVGLPARVAVGYRTPADKSGASTVTFTTADAHAWAEVLFDQYGWVPFEPTDVSAPDQQRPPDTPSGPGGDTPQSGTGGQAATVDPNLTDGSSGLVAQILLALAVLVGLVALAGATGVVIQRVRRHRRLHAAGAEMRIAGAWAESLDRLAENGLRPPLSATPSEVADSLTSRIGFLVAAPVERLAPLLAAAVFAPDRRSLSEATSAWDCEADLARALGARRPILLRAGRYLDPRPLFPPQQRGWRLPTRLQTPHFVHRGAR